MFARSVLKRSFSLLGGAQRAKLPDLPYGYGDLAPALTADILEIHHGKHHAKYVKDYNGVLEQFEAAASKGDHQTVADLGRHLRFHAGGHVNHSLYWENLAPANKEGGDLPAKDSELSKLVHQHFGNFEKFFLEFESVAAKIQGSGWGWLAYCPKTNTLSIEQSKDQSCVTSYGVRPLITVDVWEHAYYLQYKNERPAYLKKIWEVINWKTAERRLKEAKGHGKPKENEGRPV